MADDLSITQGSGTTIRTTDVAGVHTQHAKLAFGATGVATPVSDAAPLPVAIVRDTVEVTPTLDTAALASGDLMCDTTEIASVALGTGRTVTLNHLVVIDKGGHTNVGLIFHFFDRDVNPGSLNAPPTLSDTDAAFYLGSVEVPAGEWHSFTNASVASADINPLDLKPSAASIWYFITIIGAGTYAANDLVCKFKVEKS